MVGLSLARLGRNEEARAELDRAITHDLGFDSRDEAGRKMTEVQIRGAICTSYLDQRDLERAEPCRKPLLDVASNCEACAPSVPYVLNNLSGSLELYDLVRDPHEMNSLLHFPESARDPMLAPWLDLLRGCAGAQCIEYENAEITP